MAEVAVLLLEPFTARDNVGKKLILEYSVDEINWINACERVLDEPAKVVHFNETWIFRHCRKDIIV